jgi:hypothetical protein
MTDGNLMTSDTVQYVEILMIEEGSGHLIKFV